MRLNIQNLAIFVVALGTCIGATAAPTAFDLKVPLGLVAPKIPPNNPLTEQKVALGKKLFFDGRLSMNGAMSCATCHMPEHGFADFMPLGFTVIGGNLGRNTPTTINAAFNDYQFWDGRSTSLEGQVQEVFHLTADTSIDAHEIVKKLNAMPEYVADFQQAFNSPPTVENMCQAIASYERTTLSGDTRFDRYYFKGEKSALTPLEKQGFDVFMGKGQCVVCHTVSRKTADNPGSALFLDQQFHNLGVGSYTPKRMKDGGRYLVTGDCNDLGKFKTPGLRNVELTDPYMHDGSLPTLEAVVELYDRGGNPNKNLDSRIKPLHLSADEKKALVAFLKTLTDEKLAKAYVPVPKLKEQLDKMLQNE